MVDECLPVATNTVVGGIHPQFASQNGNPFISLLQ